MGELLLIRHGQASFGADRYDQLSELGYRQARWLGEYFRQREIVPGRVVIGTQQRHRQTIDAIAEGLQQPLSVDTDAGWNEFDFQHLIEVFARHYPQQAHYDAGQPKTFFKVMRRAMLAWAEQRIDGDLQESWQQFQDRVGAALRNLQAAPACGSVFAISSSGPISATLTRLLGSGPPALIDLYFQARNTAINQFFFNADTVRVSAFNGVPHLDQPDRRNAVSFI